jgi:hypothetical protein
MGTQYRTFKIRNKIWLWTTLKGHFKVTNVKIAYIFLTVPDSMSVCCLLNLWIVAKRREIDPSLPRDTIGKAISAFQNPQNNLTLDDLE